MWREGRPDEAVRDLSADFEWVVPNHPEGEVRGSGVPTEMAFAQLWTFREGQAVRMELYWDEDDARRAAGVQT